MDPKFPASALLVLAMAQPFATQRAVPFCAAAHPDLFSFHPGQPDMHELAVCQGLMTQVELVAQRENAERVTLILLSIGPLSGVEAQLLTDAFPIAAAGTVAEAAELVIEQQPVKVKCLSCGAESEARPNRLLCGACGDYRTQLLSGDEMMLLSVELERRQNA